MYRKKEKANHSSYLHDSHISLSASVLIYSLSLQQIQSFFSLESVKTVQIFLYASQGEANVFPIFTKLLGTSRSVCWTPKVLQQVCSDSLTLQLIQAFELIWGWGGQSQTIVPLTTPPRSASHAKGTFTSSKTFTTEFPRSSK